MRVTTFYRFNGITYQYFAINYTKNICEEQWSTLNYKPDFHTSILFDAFKEYSDLIRPCPYEVIYTLYSNI